MDDGKRKFKKKINKVEKHVAFLGNRLEVLSKKNEHTEKLIKRFLKKVKNDGILQEVILRRVFIRKSDIRRKKKEKAKYLQKMNKNS